MVWHTSVSNKGDRKGPHPAPHLPRSYNEPMPCRHSHSKGGGGEWRGGDPCGRPGGSLCNNLTDTPGSMHSSANAHQAL